MSLIPDLERDLVRAARAQAKLRRRRWSVTSARGLVIAFAALLVVAGGGIAANTLLFGADEHRTQPVDIFGDAPEPGTAKLLAVRTPDPDGGPAWGMRMYRTDLGRTCVQVGRVNAGELGVVGSDGAFHDDGRFHRIPIQTSNCIRSLDSSRGMGGGFEPRPASGELYGEHGTCQRAQDRLSARRELAAQRRRLAVRRRAGRSTVSIRRTIRELEGVQAHVVETCAPGRERTIIADVAGTDATSVTLHALSGDVTRPLDPSDYGAFLFVLRGWPSDVMPELPPYVSVTYRSGVTCPDDGPTRCVGLTNSPWRGPKPIP